MGISLKNYLAVVSGVGQAMADENNTANILETTEIAPIAKEVSYDNYNYHTSRKKSSQPYQYGQTEGKIHDSKGSYLKFASTLLYTILPYGFNGLTEQLVPLEEGLLGRTWINTLSDKKSELSNKLSVAALLEVQLHELEHQIHPEYDEGTNRKSVQGRLLINQGNTGIYHSDRIV